MTLHSSGAKTASERAIGLTSKRLRHRSAINARTVSLRRLSANEGFSQKTLRKVSHKRSTHTYALKARIRRTTVDTAATRSKSIWATMRSVNKALWPRPPAGDADFWYSRPPSLYPSGSVAPCGFGVIIQHLCSGRTCFPTLIPRAFYARGRASARLRMPEVTKKTDGARVRLALIQMRAREAARPSCPSRRKYTRSVARGAAAQPATVGWTAQSGDLAASAQVRAASLIGAGHKKNKIAFLRLLGPTANPLSVRHFFPRVAAKNLCLRACLIRRAWQKQICGGFGFERPSLTRSAASQLVIGQLHCRPPLPFSRSLP
jgi:hypothetical protein